MTARSADWHLLFGLLALQNGLISREQLVAAFTQWTSDKSAALNEILVRDGVIDEQISETLGRLVDLHVRKHGGEQKSLMALSGSDIGDAREALDQVDDVDLRQLISQLPEPHSRLTRSLSMGDVTSQGQRFRILRPLPGARGGMGVISVARDEELGRQVALKEIIESKADHQGYRQKFQIEAEVTGNLEHPGIVPIYGLGTDPQGRPYYTMRLVHGHNLTQTIHEFHQRSTGKIGYSSVEFRSLIDRLIDVAQAVSYAHSRGVLHRDLKPGNILVGKYGETLVIDWGLARLPKTDATADQRPEVKLDSLGPLQIRSGSDLAETVQGSALGTIGYAPPEQLSGRTDLISERSDVYALGAILYQILTGTSTVGDKQTDRELNELIQIAIAGRIKPPREIEHSIPKSLAAICTKALAREPSDRYQTAAELIAELENWRADQPVQAVPDSLLDRLARFARHHRAATVVGAIGVLIVAIVTSAALVANSAARRRAEDAGLFADVMHDFVVQDLAGTFAGTRVGGVAFAGPLWETSSRFTQEFPDHTNAQLRLHVAFGNALLKLGNLEAADQHFEAARNLLPKATVPPLIAWQAENGAAIVRWRRGDDEAIEILNNIRAEIQQQPEPIQRWFNLEYAAAMKNTLGSLDLQSQFKSIDEVSAIYARYLPAADETPDDVSNNFVQMIVLRGLTWQNRAEQIRNSDLRTWLWPLDQAATYLSVQHLREAHDGMHNLIQRLELTNSQDALLAEVWSEYAKVLHRLGISEHDPTTNRRHLVEADDAYQKACELSRRELGKQHWRTVETSYSWMVLLDDHLPPTDPPDIDRRIGRGTDYYLRQMRHNGNAETVLEQNAVGALSQASALAGESSETLKHWLNLDREVRDWLADYAARPRR